MTKNDLFPKEYIIKLRLRGPKESTSKDVEKILNCTIPAAEILEIKENKSL